jgi:hypothetical protein
MRWGKPSRYDVPEDPITVFDYHAKVDILGWTFTKRTNGEFWIRTSDFVAFVDADGKTNAEAHFSSGVADLLKALIVLGDGEPSVIGFPPGAKGIGVSL